MKQDEIKNIADAIDELENIADALNVPVEQLNFEPIKHEGRATHRLKSNLLEEVFADEWRKLNDRNRGVLEYLLAEDLNKGPCGEMTQRDATVAATVMQWLGSQLGQVFLRNVKERYATEKR